ncbi:hypothetical protein V6N13_024222 [Hibiscus sabdariffa]|uniref:Uncharacterized protein n=1 Tax=Hibiscus sabdariffa TaxID=183260 RepID=A0ABR2BWU0_9ROSI
MLSVEVGDGNQANKLISIVFSVQPHVSPSMEYGPLMHVPRCTYRSSNLSLEWGRGQANTNVQVAGSRYAALSGENHDEFDGTGNVAHVERKEADHLGSSRSLQLTMDSNEAVMNVMKVLSEMKNIDPVAVKAMVQREVAEKSNRVRYIGDTRIVLITIKRGNHLAITITDDATIHTPQPATRNSKIKETGFKSLAVSRQPAKKVSSIREEEQSS